MAVRAKPGTRRDPRSQLPATRGTDWNASRSSLEYWNRKDYENHRCPVGLLRRMYAIRLLLVWLHTKGEWFILNTARFDCLSRSEEMCMDLSLYLQSDLQCMELAIVWVC